MTHRSKEKVGIKIKRSSAAIELKTVSYKAHINLE